MATLGYLFSKKTTLYMSQLVTFFCCHQVEKYYHKKINAHYIIQSFVFMGGAKEIIDTLCWM
jgi:uncharacterized protein YktA (UPF0223 family)